MKLYTIKKYAAILLCLAAFTSCDTDAEGTKYGVNGVEAAFASTQVLKTMVLSGFPCIVEIQMQRLQSALAWMKLQ